MGGGKLVASGEVWQHLGAEGSAGSKRTPRRPEFIICVSTLQDLTTRPKTKSFKHPLEHNRFRKPFSLGMPATLPCSASNTPGYVPSQSTSRSYCGWATTLRIT
jgi:hypothetical protein